MKSNDSLAIVESTCTPAIGEAADTETHKSRDPEISSLDHNFPSKNSDQLILTGVVNTTRKQNNCRQMEVPDSLRHIPIQPHVPSRKTIDRPFGSMEDLFLEIDIQGTQDQNTLFALQQGFSVTKPRFDFGDKHVIDWDKERVRVYKALDNANIPYHHIGPVNNNQDHLPLVIEKMTSKARRIFEGSWINWDSDHTVVQNFNTRKQLIKYNMESPTTQPTVSEMVQGIDLIFKQNAEKAKREILPHQNKLVLLCKYGQCTLIKFYTFIDKEPVTLYQISVNPDPETYKYDRGPIRFDYNPSDNTSEIKTRKQGNMALYTYDSKTEKALPFTAADIIADLQETKLKFPDSADVDSLEQSAPTQVETVLEQTETNQPDTLSLDQAQ